MKNVRNKYEIYLYRIHEVAQKVNLKEKNNVMKFTIVHNTFLK